MPPKPASLTGDRLASKLAATRAALPAPLLGAIEAFEAKHTGDEVELQRDYELLKETMIRHKPHGDLLSILSVSVRSRVQKALRAVKDTEKIRARLRREHGLTYEVFSAVFGGGMSTCKPFLVALDELLAGMKGEEGWSVGGVVDVVMMCATMRRRGMDGFPSRGIPRETVVSTKDVKRAAEWIKEQRQRQQLQQQQQQLQQQQQQQQHTPASARVSPLPLPSSHNGSGSHSGNSIMSLDVGRFAATPLRDFTPLGLRSVPGSVSGSGSVSCSPSHPLPTSAGKSTMATKVPGSQVHMGHDHDDSAMATEGPGMQVQMGHDTITDDGDSAMAAKVPGLQVRMGQLDLSKHSTGTSSPTQSTLLHSSPLAPPPPRSRLSRLPRTVAAAPNTPLPRRQPRVAPPGITVSPAATATFSNQTRVLDTIRGMVLGCELHPDDERVLLEAVARVDRARGERVRWGSGERRG